MAIKIIGAGLAGCEAAWQAAKYGAEVILYYFWQDFRRSGKMLSKV